MQSRSSLSQLVVAAACWLPAGASAAAHAPRWSDRLLQLPLLLALGIALHSLASFVLKQALLRVTPLARGEPRVTGYERGVHDSPEPSMLAVLALAAGGGAALWIMMALDAPSAGVAAGALLFGALALDLAQWHRVEVSDEHVWFQRGLWGSVHQVLIENLGGVAIEAAEQRGVSLRHGFGAHATLRLRLTLKNRHVAALPKTSATHCAQVERVAAHIELRLASRRAESSLRRAEPERQLKRALRRLRRQAARA